MRRFHTTNGHSNISDKRRPLRFSFAFIVTPEFSYKKTRLPKY